MGDTSDDGLPAGMDMHVFNTHLLLAAAAEPRERLYLRRVSPQELHCETAAALQGDDAVRLLRPSEHLHCDFVGANHLDGEHGLNLIVGVDPIDGSQCGVQSLLIGDLLAPMPHHRGEPSEAEGGECARRCPERI